MDHSRSLPEKVAAELARALRRRRKELGLTQKQLSALAGCGVAFMYDLEKGKPTLRLDKLIDVLEVLGLELVLTEGKHTFRVGDGLVGEGER